MKILGIDPGKTGCLAVIRDGALIDYLHMPMMDDGSAKQVVNAAFIRDFVEDHGLIDYCFLERVASRPGQGVSSSFNFGFNTGMVRGAVEASGLRCRLVTPQRWKAYHSLLLQDKDAARLKAKELEPMFTDLDKKAKGQALADAYLLALYGASTI